ncbi:MAG: hypothetical protein NTU47_00250 [Ignavibacteriales bacterium]|nr:hypothetical protein [Ignavibacteriales bacterium]
MVKFLKHCRHVCYLLVGLLILEAAPYQLARGAEGIKVTNVSFRLVGTRIAVNYDLEGMEKETYRTRISLRKESDSTFVYVPRQVNGDVGDGVYAGANKQITWDFLTEFPGGLEGSDYYFTIEAEVYSPGSNLIYWIGGVVAAAAAAAAYLLGTKASTSATSDTGFPAPVGRPSGGS